MSPQIILASQSPRRSALLKADGYTFETIPSRAHEKEATHEDVHEVVVANARIKGSEVARRLEAEAASREGQVIIAADTLVVLGNKVYGKPKNLEQAAEYIRELMGKQHEVLTGVFLHRLGDGREDAFCESTKVVIKPMTDREIEDLFHRVDPLDKAGAYGFQDSPDIVSRLVGSRSNIIGLPMEALKKHLEPLTR